MLEYCSYALSAQWWSEDAYAAEVLSHDGRLQYFNGEVYRSSQPWNGMRLYRNNKRLTCDGRLLHGDTELPIAPLHTYVIRDEGTGAGLTCQGEVVQIFHDKAYPLVRFPDLLVFTLIDDCCVYLTSQGECWVWSKQEHYPIPLPYKPLGLCAGFGSSLFFLLPNDIVQQWYRRVKGSYVPGLAYKLKSGHNWLLCEHRIHNS